MKTLWLKALGVTGHPVDDDWRSKTPLEKKVMFPRKPHIRPGDRLVYYAVGDGVIFAEGETRSIPYYEKTAVGKDGRHYPWWVDMHIDHGVEFVHKGIPLNGISVGERKLSKLMQRRSHIRLEPAEYKAAVRALSEQV
jgi:hypothetical protein